MERKHSLNSLKTLFANKFYILNFKFIKMIKDIISFYNYAPSLLKTDLEGETLGNYLNREKFSKYFIR